MLDRLFAAHPRAVGESYLAHAATALGFGAAMIGGGLACLVHAAVPALFTTTGSDTVRRLAARMGTRRGRPAPDGRGALVYEI